MKGRTKAMQVRAEVVSMSIRCTCKGEMTKWGEWTQCEKGVGVTTGKSSWDEIPRHHAFNWHLTTICGPLKKKILVYHWTWKKNLSCHPHHSKASGKISPAQSSRTVHFAHTVQPLGKSIVSFQRYLLSSTTKYSSIHHIQGDNKETENNVLWGAWDITSR